MKLSELRKQHPTIKSRTKAGFLQQLKEAEGLGDTIAAVTSATKLDKVVEWLSGEDCGCTERKNKLNEIFRYKVECMVESEYIWWTEFLKRKTGVVKPPDVFEISRLFIRLFNKKPALCINCAGAGKRLTFLIDSINKVYLTYEHPR